MTDTLDLRSLAPTFERKITWIDGTEYSIREIDDLTEAEFITLLADEQQSGSLPISEQHEMQKRHMQMMVVIPRPAAISNDLQEGDIVYAVSAGNVERAAVVSVDGSLVFSPPWSDAASVIRAYRAIRRSEIDNLTERQFMGALTFVKTPPKKDGDKEGSERPPIAVS